VNKYRLEIITRLGGACTECNISDVRVLEIDHHWRDGAQDRKHYSGNSYYRLILRDLDAGFRDRYKILCANCHRINHTKFDTDTLADGEWVF
jgi:hypothetical protein